MTGSGQLSCAKVKYMGFGFENVEVIAVNIDDILELDLDGITKDNIKDLNEMDELTPLNKVNIKIKYENIEPYTVGFDDHFCNFNNYPEVTYKNTHRVANRDDLISICFLDKDFNDITKSFYVTWHDEENPWITPMQNKLHHNELINENENIYYKISIG